MNPNMLLSCKEQNSRGNKRPRRVASQGGDTKIPRQWLGSCTDRRQRRFQGHRKGAQRPRITAADPTCLFRSAVSVALHLDQVLFILAGNLQTLNSYMEFCFPGRTHAAINGPDESRRAQQGMARGFVARGRVPVQFGASDSAGSQDDSPPEAGFSQSRRASGFRWVERRFPAIGWVPAAVCSWRSAGR